MIKFITVARALVFCFVVYQVNAMIYDKDPDWKHFREYKPKAMKVVNNGIFRYIPPEERKKILQKTGWKSSDFNMMLNWFFMDEEVYSLEKIDRFLSLLPPAKKVPVKQAVKLAKKRLTASFSISCLLFFIFSLSMLSFNRRLFFLLITGVFTVLALMFYLIYFIKAPPQRVYFPLMAFVALLPLLIARKEEFYCNWNKIRKASLVVLASLLTWQAVIAVNEYKNESAIHNKGNKRLHSIISQLNPDDRQLFVLWGAAFPWEFVTPFDNPAFLKNFNTFGLGTAQHSPDNRKMLQQFGIENLYLDLADKNGVFLVIKNGLETKSIPKFKRFVREHYSRELVASKIGETREFLIFKIK